MHRALQIPEVLDHILNFLTPKDLKRCRLVNRKWRLAGTKHLRDSSQIVFNFIDNDENGKRQIQAKMDAIKNAYIAADREKEITPFDSFAFKGKIALELFAPFVRNVGPRFREMVIAGVMKDLSYPGRKIYDLSPFLSSKLCNLKILDISWKLWHTSTFRYKLNLESIRCIPDLRLGNCIIVVCDEDGKPENRKCISPHSLLLRKSITIEENGENVREILINAFFDLTNSTNITLRGKNVSFDFSNCGSNSLIGRVISLSDTKVQNWSKCNWEVNSLSLTNVPFVENTCIKAREIIFTGITINLSVIQRPELLHNLNLIDNELVFSKPFFFPNLENLLLVNRSLQLLPHFSENKKLLRVNLINILEDDITVNIGHLCTNNTLKTLQLQSVNLEDGEQIFSVLELNLVYYIPFSEYQKVAQRFTTNRLLIQDRIFKLDMNDVVQFLNVSRPLTQCREFLIGEFKWNHSSNLYEVLFSSYGSYGYVDQKAAFYYFAEGQKGRSISKGDFMKCLLSG